MEEIWSF